MNKNLAELITTFLNFRNNEYWGDHILTISIKDTGDCSIWLFTLEMSKDEQIKYEKSEKESIKHK